MITALALMLPLLAPAAAEVHKCKDALGHITYTDQPCPDTAKSLAVPSEALKDAPVDWLCEAQKERNEPKLTLDSLTEVQRRSFLLTGYTEAFLRLNTARHFGVRGNFYLCDESQPGSSVELVVTPDGHVWARRNGRISHTTPVEAPRAGIKPAIEISPPPPPPEPEPS